MAKKERERRMQLPPSSGGLVRYMEEERTKIWIKPAYLIAFLIALIVIMALVHLFGPQPAF